MMEMMTRGAFPFKPVEATPHWLLSAASARAIVALTAVGKITSGSGGAAGLCLICIAIIFLGFYRRRPSDACDAWLAGGHHYTSDTTIPATMSCHCSKAARWARQTDARLY